MRKFLLCATAAATLAACNNTGTGSKGGASDSTLNAAFSNYEQRFIDALWKENPDWATGVGYHNYDSVLIVPDEAASKAALAFAQQQLDSLKSFDKSKLTDANQTDYQLIENFLQSAQWGIKELKSNEWDPSSFNVSNTFAFILNENYAPLESRLRSIAIRLQNIPAYYEAAKKQIKDPVPELTALAIDQNNGGVSVFEKDLLDSLNKTSIPAAEKATIVARAKAAATAIKGYATWLKDLKPANPRSFRLGQALYEQKFNYSIQSSFSASQIYDSAVARKRFVHGEMMKISRQLWPKYFGNTPVPTDSLELVGRMIDTLSVRHVKPEEFQSAIEKQLPSLIAFIKEKDLLYIDPSKPLVVRKEPAYMAGVAGASISAPGPYDKGGNTYYNVGSLEGWPKERAESYLREYNQYILQILDIHEAIPGHYTQLVYANQSPSLIKSLMGNGAMIEGWAVYTEQMMLENGYGNDEPEMWLMWYKWNLRAVCNTILDYSVHVKNMSKEEAIHLLTKEAFQQQAEAEGKWKRVSVTSVQLTSYFTGYKEIIDLREAYKQQEGSNYKLKTFNEKFLSYGSAPVKYIRQLMLKK
ncbi:DUF885 domain-containing protein [Chitinophaga nivalis]|uniref:DUF885 domain-containing protein n=1 Tax=Chitinophaga nivalis TaxID=2991709 RepID=A0ABT3IQJ6_9BACT|nr:DUF885 domain-containing protein [Chitinophaga nivalis]MCW3464269.1 DUF885 domain-containing protein [Chitinophaga nivalis]MCW3486040.1 DUF885 domain-containing protein [Chitinophaga nivalis]